MREFGRATENFRSALNRCFVEIEHSAKDKQCLAFRQALLTRGRGAENEAMLKSSGPALGARLKEALQAAGVSVPIVAEACGVSKPAVYAWFRTGRVAKKHLTKLSSLARRPLAELLSGEPLVEVFPAPQTEVIEVELPRDAIDLARSWMVLPENERNEFRRKIETAALRYRDHVSDARMRSWGNGTAAIGPKKPPPKGGGTQ